MLAFFKASTFFHVGDGRTALFWEDKWINEEAISDLAPCLFQLVPANIKKRLTVREGLHNRQWVRSITGGMSQAAIIEYQELWRILHEFNLSDQRDRLVWRWTPDGTYTAKSAYKMLQAGSVKFRGHSLIWKTWAPLRVKIFLWLAMKRKHWTADRRARHGLETHDRCLLCDQEPETIDHLLACCPFTREIWHFVLTAVGLQLPPGARSSIAWWRKLRKVANGEKWRGIDSLFALVSW